MKDDVIESQRRVVVTRGWGALGGGRDREKMPDGAKSLVCYCMQCRGQQQIVMGLTQQARGKDLQCSHHKYTFESLQMFNSITIIYTQTFIHACRQQASCGMPLTCTFFLYTYICVYVNVHVCANAHEGLRLMMNIFIDHAASYIVKAGSLLNPEFTVWACSRDGLILPPLLG